VTCLCLTRNRRQWLPQAIQCWTLQTYANRELLIVADGEDVQDLVPANDASIRLVHLAAMAQIGDKRNLGCELARGSVIAHWDDDDYSAPERLADQVERLHATWKAVTGYHSMRFTDGQRAWRYQGSLHYAIGTSLCYRRAWWQVHPFPSQQVGEDNAFVQRAASQQQLATAEAGELMHATIHPGNTSPRPLSGPNWIAL
jgi:glycosyltransferase involved in cell wall biosynthesis